MIVLILKVIPIQKQIRVLIRDIEPINVGMLKGYMKPKHYKKILIEEDLLPD